MSAPAHEYRAYGLRVRSDIPLPFDLQPEPPEPALFEPDVTVRCGACPATLPAGPGHVTSSHIWQARPGAFLLHIEGVARYLVTDGRDVLIEPLGGDADDVTAFFVDTPLTVLLQQRGVVTLHAAAIATKAGAVLFLGGSGIGKSALAAALVERGAALLADDVTGVVLDAGGGPLALPAFPRRRLWAHTLDEMGWRSKVHAPLRCGMQKYWLREPRFCRTPLPVCAAFVLGSHNLPNIGLDLASPGTAFRLMSKYTHRKRAMQGLGQRPAHFRVITKMARHVPVTRVIRPAHPFLLEALADRVEAHLRAAQSAGGTRGRLKMAYHLREAEGVPARGIVDPAMRSSGIDDDSR